MHDCLGEQEDVTEEKWLMTILISDRRQGMTWIRISAKDIPVLRPVWRNGMLTCLINLCWKFKLPNMQTGNSTCNCSSQAFCMLSCWE